MSLNFFMKPRNIIFIWTFRSSVRNWCHTSISDYFNDTLPVTFDVPDQPWCITGATWSPPVCQMAFLVWVLKWYFSFEVGICYLTKLFAGSTKSWKVPFIFIHTKRGSFMGSRFWGPEKMFRWTFRSSIRRGLMPIYSWFNCTTVALWSARQKCL